MTSTLKMNQCYFETTMAKFIRYHFLRSLHQRDLEKLKWG